MVGVKDRATKRVAARVVERTDAETLQGFVAEHAASGAIVYTDDASAYDGIPFDHETVKHSLSEYVKGDVHTNGIESLWSMFKRAHKGIYHKMSPKHLESVRAGVRRTAQPARHGHAGADGRGGPWPRGAFPDLCRAQGRQRAVERGARMLIRTEPHAIVSFQGGLADHHQVDMRQLGESLIGIERIVTIGLFTLDVGETAEGPRETTAGGSDGRASGWLDRDLDMAGDWSRSAPADS